MSYLALPVSLDINQTANIAANATPQVLALPNIAQIMNCGYDPATGIVTLQQNGTYTFEFQFLATSLLGGRLSFYAEVDTGGGFVPRPNSARTRNVTGLQTDLVAFGATVYFAQGTRVRCYLFGTGYTLASNTPTNSPVACPAARITMTN